MKYECDNATMTLHFAYATVRHVFHRVHPHPDRSQMRARVSYGLRCIWFVLLPRHRNGAKAAVQASRSTQIAGSTTNRTGSQNNTPFQISESQRQTQPIIRIRTPHFIGNKKWNFAPRFLPNRRAGPCPPFAGKVSSQRRRRSSDYWGTLLWAYCTARGFLCFCRALHRLTSNSVVWFGLARLKPIDQMIQLVMVGLALLQELPLL